MAPAAQAQCGLGGGNSIWKKSLQPRLCERCVTSPSKKCRRGLPRRPRARAVPAYRNIFSNLSSGDCLCVSPRECVTSSQRMRHLLVAEAGCRNLRRSDKEEGVAYLGHCMKTIPERALHLLVSILPQLVAEQTKQRLSPLPLCQTELVEATLSMLVLRSQDELKVLKKELESCFPKSLKVHGAVVNVCRGNPFHQEVLVDSWPSFQVVIARLQREKAPSETNYFSQSCAVFYKNLDSYKQLVKDTDAIDWDQEFLLQGLQDGVWQTSQSLTAIKHFSTKLVSRTQVFVLQKPFSLPATTAVLGSELKLSSFNTTHATLLNETWSVGGSEQSLHYLTQLICCFPSSCLLNATGFPISWVLLDQFGCLTHAYTMPAHRGKGYIQLVIAALAQKIQSLSYPVYGDVLEDNTPMKKALQCLEACFPACFLSYDLHTPAATGSSNS